VAQRSGDGSGATSTRYISPPKRSATPSTKSKSYAACSMTAACGSTVISTRFRQRLGPSRRGEARSPQVGATMVVVAARP